MDKHVFISYDHNDGDFAEILINRIIGAGFKVWIDNDQLKAGEDWRVDIDQAIKDAFALIVIMTPQALRWSFIFPCSEYIPCLGTGALRGEMVSASPAEAGLCALKRHLCFAERDAMR